MMSPSCPFLLLSLVEHIGITPSSSARMSTTTSSATTPTRISIVDQLSADRISYLTTTTTGLVVCLTTMIALMYLVVLSWAYRAAQKRPRPLNKVSGVRLQKYAPIVYVFLVLSSLCEVALSSWLVLQYRFNDNYPKIKTRTGARLLLFASSWTTLTAGVYTLLFLHPTWSKHPISSIGAQAIWVLITLILWAVGAGIINASVPLVLEKGMCEGIVYCGQIRALFGAYLPYFLYFEELHVLAVLCSLCVSGLAVLESLTLTAGMVVLLWLAWQSAQHMIPPVSKLPE
ncbi:unnamed protein product [Cyclocybe aegerita]|uniref:Uncharacterized protein n=1 Tax=Cyclocybe aegerita TaxID=1973307 RepID=A0A8S0WZD6_CYCAE|nr:unnamed protein product [Cyclocybe aegerita]